LFGSIAIILTLALFLVAQYAGEYPWLREEELHVK
jgi:hypothetical protein